MWENNIKYIRLLLLLYVYCIGETLGAQLNRTHHIRREPQDIFFKNQNLQSYRSFQPISLKYHKATYPKVDDRTDYDITSYDTEYGGVVSNFTSSIYDENPPLYPNPEMVARSNQVLTKGSEGDIIDAEAEIPDASLADIDMKGHNLIDSLSYLYGFNNCHARTEWTILIFIASGISVALLGSTVLWLMFSEHAQEFRESSKLYPLSINLCCCLEACLLIYIQAVMGVSSPSQCEKVALLLHYTYLTCSLWIVLIALSVAEYSRGGHVMSLQYNYLLAYGVPAVVVMFNYALSMEQYEIKHYCWMSIEKGMVVGFMAPAMVLIIINTALCILGLKSVQRKQAEILTANIQELVKRHFGAQPKPSPEPRHKHCSIDTLDCMNSASSSRKNTDSSDTLDRDNACSDQEGACAETNPAIEADKTLLGIILMDNLSWKSTMNGDVQVLKKYLNLCLILEPFFAVNWVMGVVAVENAASWPTPALYLLLLQTMYIYLTITVCTALPIVNNEKTEEPCCEEVVVKPSITITRSTDSTPLLDPTVSQPNVTPAPADTISTISM